MRRCGMLVRLSGHSLYYLDDLGWLWASHHVRCQLGLVEAARLIGEVSGCRLARCEAHL